MVKVLQEIKKIKNFKIEKKLNLKLLNKFNNFMDIDNLCNSLKNNLSIFDKKDEEYLELAVNYLIFQNNLELRLSEVDFERIMDRYVRYLFGISWNERNRNDIEEKLHTFVNYCNYYTSLSNKIIKYIDTELFKMIRGHKHPLYSLALVKFKSKYHF